MFSKPARERCVPELLAQTALMLMIIDDSINIAAANQAEVNDGVEDKRKFCKSVECESVI